MLVNIIDKQRPRQEHGLPHVRNYQKNEDEDEENFKKALEESKKEYEKTHPKEENKGGAGRNQMVTSEVDEDDIMVIDA